MNRSLWTAPRTCQVQSKTRATWATFSSRKWPASHKRWFKSLQLLPRHQARETATQAPAYSVLRAKTGLKVGNRCSSHNPCPRRTSFRETTSSNSQAATFLRSKRSTATLRRQQTCSTSLSSKIATLSRAVGRLWTILLGAIPRTWVWLRAMIWVQLTTWGSTRRTRRQVPQWQITSWYSHRCPRTITCSCNSTSCRVSSHSTLKIRNRCTSSRITSLLRSTWVGWCRLPATRQKELTVRMLRPTHTWQHNN